MAVLVLQNIVSCLKEMITQGQPVKLDGFGTFTPTIETDGQKAVETVEGSLNVGIDNLIAGVHLRFIPENSKGDELTSARSVRIRRRFRLAHSLWRQRQRLTPLGIKR